MLIMLWGPRNDTPLRAVGEELARSGAPTLLVDQHEVLGMSAELRVGQALEGYVNTGAGQHDLAAVTALYNRAHDARHAAAVARAGEGSAAWRHAAAMDDLLWAWSALTPALVINRAAPMATNSSKPYQLERIRRAGLLTPDTLVTTDPQAAAAFWEQHGAVVYKSVSGVRSIVGRLGPEHRGRLNDVRACPTQFQQYIPGRDHRVHVVGDELFAAEISCEAADYRYPQGSPVAIGPCDLPPEVAAACLRVASALELPVAGIDLRRTPEGAWYCFEVNPSPAFTYYERRTGQPIAASIARLLAGRAKG